MKPIVPIAFLLISPLYTAVPVCAETDFVRELARNKPKVVVAYSGKDSLDLAIALRDALWGHPDWGKRSRSELELCPVSAIGSRVAAFGVRTSVVSLISGSDLRAGAPSEGMEHVPLDSKVLGARTSVVTALSDSLRAGEPVFRIGLYAPDAARLARILGVFSQRRVGSYRDLPFTARYGSNRVAVFTEAALRPLAERWGELRTRDVWDDVVWYPIDRRDGLEPDALRERISVYFADRSHLGASDLPEEARAVLRNVSPLSPTAVAVAAGVSDGGEPVYVVSAPSARLLRTRIDSFRSVRDLAAAAGQNQELPDLTRLGMAPLLVVNGGQRLTAETIESLHAEVAEALRGLELAIEPRGTVVARMEAEIAAQMARGAADAEGALRRDSVARYAWVLTVTDVATRTTYRPEDRKLTPPPARFALAEPERPRRRRNESDDDYEDRNRDYQRAWNQWERERRDWQDRYARATCDWSQTVRAAATVRVRGLLQLFDTRSSAGAKPVYSTPWSAEGTDTSIWREQRVQVKGHDARPTPLRVPPTVETSPPELLLDALRRGTRESVDALRREAVLPEPGLRLAAGPVAGFPRVGEDDRVTGKVAEVVDGMVALNVGARHGVRVGDRFEVLISVRETRDPDTGKVLRTRVEERLVVVVRSVDTEVCDAVPELPAEMARIKRIQIGMTARPIL